MKAIDQIRWALQFTEQGTEAILEGMRDHALTRSTPGAKGGDGNHTLWSLGHICVIEAGIPHILLGEDDPLEHWWPLFGTGTQPSDDASIYPSFDQVLSTYRQARARNLKLLEEIGESGLDRVPKNVPPGFEDMMTTFGQTLLLITLHNMVHYGQIADARRVAGLKPLL
jgi:hypothetical protein